MMAAKSGVKMVYNLSSYPYIFGRHLIGSIVPAQVLNHYIFASLDWEPGFELQIVDKGFVLRGKVSQTGITFRPYRNTTPKICERVKSLVKSLGLLNSQLRIIS